MRITVLHLPWMSCLIRPYDACVAVSLSVASDRALADGSQVLSVCRIGECCLHTEEAASKQGIDLTLSLQDSRTAGLKERDL